MSAEGKVSFATLVHGIIPAAQARVDFATIVHGVTPAAQARVDFATIVHGIDPAAQSRVNFATIVHGIDPAAQSRVNFATIVHLDQLIEVTVPNITGVPESVATFDGSGSTNPDYYGWTWVSVPGGSAINLDPAVPFPDDGAATPIDMTSNVALWHFEGDADDTSGEGNDGTVSGATQVAGKIGSYAYSFDGVNDYIEVTGSDVFPGTANAITISLWQYGDSSQPQQDTIFEGDDASGNRVVNAHLPWNNGWIYWDCGNSGTSSHDRINKAATTAEYEGQWNHWVFTKDVASGVMKMYLNGVEWHSGTGQTRTLSAITTFRIGSGLPSTAQYAGKIDEFAVWARVLSAVEIAAIYTLQTQVYVGTSSTLAFTPDVEGTYQIKLEVFPGIDTTADAVIAEASGGGGGRQSRRSGQARGRGFSVTEINSSLSAGFNSSFD